MTAPVAPVSAPASPIAPLPSMVPDSGRTVTDMIAAVAAHTGIAADPVIDTPVVKFAKDAPAPTAPTPVAVDPAAIADPVAAAPVADPAAPIADPASEPSSELTLDDGEISLTAERNADGTFKTKIDPTAKFDFKLTDKATGETKTYSKTIPELARLAKDGIRLQPLVQQLKPEAEYYRANIPKWQEGHAALESQLSEQIALNRELLSAPDETVVARREEYAREMSPEKRLERMEAKQAEDTRRAEQSRAQTEVTRRANHFLETRIKPVIADAEAQLGVEAVAGKIALATQPLMENGVIPPKHWAAVESYVYGPFREWVKAELGKRTSADAAIQKARDDAAAEQRRAQAAINESGRALAPIGRAGAESVAPKTKPANVRDAIDRINNRPLPSSVQPVASG